MKLIFSIAKSLLLARWKQTLVAAFGVTFSITMFITLLGFMNGLNDLLDGIILNRTPHIRLYNELLPSAIQPIEVGDTNQHHFISSVKPKNEMAKIDNYLAIKKTLERDERVLGIAPKVTAQVFYNVGPIDITGVINGVDVDTEKKFFKFADYVPKGWWILGMSFK
jgi:lipoprotein-releasing system permease protein